MHVLQLSWVITRFDSDETGKVFSKNYKKKHIKLKILVLVIQPILSTLFYAVVAELFFILSSVFNRKIKGMLILFRYSSLSKLRIFYVIYGLVVRFFLSTIIMVEFCDRQNLKFLCEIDCSNSTLIDSEFMNEIFWLAKDDLLSALSLVESARWFPAEGTL